LADALEIGSIFMLQVQRYAFLTRSKLMLRKQQSRHVPALQ